MGKIAQRHLLSKKFETANGLITSTTTQLKFLFVFPNSTITLTKVYTRRISDKVITLQLCFLDVLPRHSNIVTDKGFNIFNECAAR